MSCTEQNTTEDILIMMMSRTLLVTLAMGISPVVVCGKFPYGVPPIEPQPDTHLSLAL